MSELIIHSGKLQGRRLTLPIGEIVIGRDESCQMRVNSNDVSRRHCALRTTAEGIFVRDLESSNGTYVNDIPITVETRLRPGDLLRVGNMVFQVPPSVGAAPILPVQQTPKKPIVPPADAVKNAARRPVKKATDDDIASWLTEADAEDEQASTSDTTIIPNKRGNEAAAPAGTQSTPAPAQPGGSSTIKATEDKKAAFRTVAEEAADIIRRHHDTKKKRAN